MPPEICDEHDLPIDQYGCWACGHAGPITDLAWPSWERWSYQRFDDLYGVSPSIVG